MPRLVAVLVVTVALTVIGFACGSTSTCGPTTCPSGCCDSMGLCSTRPTSPTEELTRRGCGTNGGACVMCASTEICSNGACVADPSQVVDAGATCANCRGCCQNGVCRTGNVTNACGFDGGMCSDCTTQNRQCIAGRCQTPCGPTNCTGCCRNNECIVTTTVQACGRGGESCVLCQPRESCQAGLCSLGDGGVDAGIMETCETTCTSGCCDVAGVCQSGTSPAACGTLGSRCLTCASCMPYAAAGGGRCP
ncbi:MAG: hypothetical protein GQE15_12915 [Archangiaceae bacterium]|nr:hypothetical protein [Archangiaceae bacterium]